MAEKYQKGTSDFTYDDAQNTPYHTGVPDHELAMHFGALPATEPVEVVLGPPAYGSPDPNTLGYHLNPLTDENGDRHGAGIPRGDMKSHLEAQPGSSGGAGGGLSAESKASDFVEAVNNASSLNELRRLQNLHTKRDTPYATVEAAIERRHAELEGQS